MAQRLPFEGLVLALLELLDVIADAQLVAGLEDVLHALRFLSGDAEGKLLGRKRVADSAVVLLRRGVDTMVTPNCSLKDLRYFEISYGVWTLRSVGWRQSWAASPKVDFL